MRLISTYEIRVALKVTFLSMEFSIHFQYNESQRLSPQIPNSISFFQSCTGIVFISPGENLNRIRWANAIESSPGCAFIHFLFSLYFYFPDSREKVAISFPWRFLIYDIVHLTSSYTGVLQLSHIMLTHSIGKSRQFTLKPVCLRLLFIIPPRDQFCEKHIQGWLTLLCHMIYHAAADG